MLELVDLAFEGAGIGGIAGKHLDRDRAALACLTRNTVRLGRDHTTTLTPTPLQQRAFDLLAIKLPT